MSWTSDRSRQSSGSDFSLSAADVLFHLYLPGDSVPRAPSAPAFFLRSARTCADTNPLPGSASRPFAPVFRDSGYAAHGDRKEEPRKIDLLMRRAIDAFRTPDKCRLTFLSQREGFRPRVVDVKRRPGAYHFRSDQYGEREQTQKQPAQVRHGVPHFEILAQRPAFMRPARGDFP